MMKNFLFIIIFALAPYSFAQAINTQNLAALYSAEKWDEFFGQARSLRNHNQATDNSVALEVLALLKHCQIDIAEQLLSARSTLFSAEDRQDLQSLVQMSREMQTPGTHPHAPKTAQQHVMWPSNPNAAKSKALIQNLHVKVPNLCVE
jgi:hypothetical protein